MAIWSVTFSIRDNKGKVGHTMIHVNDAGSEQPHTEVEAFIADYTVMLDNLISGRIEHVSMTKSIVLPVGIKTLPDANSDVEEGALFVWRSQANEPVSQRIPTFSEDYIIEGTDEVDRTDPDVIDLHTYMTQPIELPSEWAVYPSDNRGQLLRDWTLAVERFKQR